MSKATVFIPPAGNRNTNGNYYNRSTNANLWSSTAGGAGAWNRNLNYDYSTVNRNDNAKAYGFSVRCLKNWILLPAALLLYCYFNEVAGNKI